MIEFIKSWSLTCNIVKTTVYMNYYDIFIIMITWIWHDMNCSCLSSEINLSWIWRNMKTHYQKTMNMSHSKYVRYELNHFICLHENKIMKYLQSWWKILRKFSNWNHTLIHDYLYLKNIMIWLMFLRDRMLMSCLHIRKNMTSELNWNQKRISILIFCIACHEKSCRYCDNIWMNILQKISFSQAILHLHFQCYLWRNWVKNYISALIIEFWMQS